jgi:chromosome segregation ATPase
VRSLEQELAAARDCFWKADEEAQTFSLEAHDVRERLASIEEKARQITAIEGWALESDHLEERNRGLETSLKATEERLKATEKQDQEAEAAAKSARQSAKLSEFARLHNSALLQQSMDKTTRLEAEIERLKAQDIERQNEIFAVRRSLNSTEANANQLTSRVAVLETEVTRAVGDLSREPARREVAENRLCAARLMVESLAGAVLGASSSVADPFERLRQVPERLRAQQREIASTGIFFGARQALGVVRSHLPRVDYSRFGRGFAGGLTPEQRREMVEGVADAARSITGLFCVSAALRHWEEQRRATIEGQAPGPVEEAP